MRKFIIQFEMRNAIMTKAEGSECLWNSKFRIKLILQAWISLISDYQKICTYIVGVHGGFIVAIKLNWMKIRIVRCEEQQMGKCSGKMKGKKSGYKRNSKREAVKDAERCLKAACRSRLSDCTRQISRIKCFLPAFHLESSSHFSISSSN